MLDNFKADLQAAKAAENLVKETFSSLTTGYKFEDVSEIREYFYRGDIKATNLTTGEEVFIEVKDDSRIATTHNILCETEVFYKEYGAFGKGNMSCDYNIYCVVSKEEHKIYVIDFKVLKEIYKKGEFKTIDHPQQTTYCYLLPIWLVKKYNGLLDIIDYGRI